MILRHVRAIACLVTVFGLVGLLVAMSAPVASADEVVTYTYTGNTFNEGFVVSGPDSLMCPPRCNISGSFTLSAPLTYPADADDVFLVPNSYSFTDGAVTFTQANSTPVSFEISLNPAGAIYEWNINIDEILPSGQCERMVTRGLNAVVDISTNYSNSSCLAPAEINQFEVGGDPGTWKSVAFVLPPCGVTIPGVVSGGDCTPGNGSGPGSGGGSGGGGGSTTVPEPGSLTLLGAGLLGGALLCLLRRC